MKYGIVSDTKDLILNYYFVQTSNYRFEVKTRH